MNTPSWFMLGTVLGMSAASAFFYFRTSAPHAVNIAPAPTASHSAPAAKSTAVSEYDESRDRGAGAAHSTVDDQALKDALREIREAGMVVIPQEFARFLMPSLLSTRPDPAVRQILQLDEAEATALAKARLNFDNAIQNAIDSRLQVVEVTDGVVTATLPAFKEERQRLIKEWRDESLACLDADSAGMASHIDFDRAIEGFYSQGSMDLTVTFKPSENARNVSVEYRGQAANGDQRRNWNHRSGGVPSAQFLKRFPSLRAHFPQLVEETKP